MKANKGTDTASSTSVNKNRRTLLSSIAAVGTGLFAFSISKKTVAEENELKFPGDPPDHKVVYQFNKADADYHTSVMFSVGAMVRKYGDNIKIVVTCFGPGIHILAKKPSRSVEQEIKERVSSLSIYGVEFHACGNTMKSLNWTKKDLYPFVTVVEVGASDLIELQEQDYSYISW